MSNQKSLISGIGNLSNIKKYYDDWSVKYDLTLNNWDYQAPKKSARILKQRILSHPKNILDLACGTGLFGHELNKIYKNSNIYGSDISYQCIKIAKEKNIYKNLKKLDFETKYDYKIRFDLISLIGAMTYCRNFNKLFSIINYYLNKKGFFIFSHRIDLWQTQDFDNILKKFSNNLKINYISRPSNYLPLNNDFKDKIKIRIVLLQKC